MSQSAARKASNVSSDNASPGQPPLKVVAPPEPLVPTDEFLAQLAAKSQELETATPQEILRWAIDEYKDKFTMATAFGPEGMTIIHMLSEIAPETPIFNLDTGYQFKETLELREEVKRLEKETGESGSS